MARQSRRYSKFNAADHKGQLGRYTIYVFFNAYDGLLPGIIGNEALPEEVVKAVELWVDKGTYASMDLTEFLRRTFSRLDYL